MNTDTSTARREAEYDKKEAEYKQRLGQEEKDMTAALASVSGRDEALKTLQREADRLASHYRKRVSDCEAAAGQSSTRVQYETWRVREPVPDAVERFLEEHYTRELERAAQDLKIGQRLRDMTYEPAP